jgi:hypothetical protein
MLTAACPSFLLGAAHRHFLRSPPEFPSDDGLPPSPVDDDEYLDGDVYAAAAENFASKMHSAAVPKAPRIYVPPESLYVRQLALLNLYTVYPFTSIW